MDKKGRYNISMHIQPETRKELVRFQGSVIAETGKFVSLGKITEIVISRGLEVLRTKKPQDPFGHSPKWRCPYCDAPFDNERGVQVHAPSCEKGPKGGGEKQDA